MLLVLYIFIKYILEPRQTSKMEISAKRTKDLQSLFAFAKNSIPEVCTGSHTYHKNSL